MGRAFPVGTTPPRSLVPWQIAHSDLVPANAGKLEFTRDLVSNGAPQKQLAMFVRGEYVEILGLMAIRCTRRMGPTGEELTPLGIALPDDSPFQPEQTFTPYMDGTQSNPRRSSEDGD